MSQPCPHSHTWITWPLDRLYFVKPYNFKENITEAYTTFSNILPCLRMSLNQDYYCVNVPFITVVLVSLFISVWKETMLWFVSESPSFFHDKGTLLDLPPAHVDSPCAYQNMSVWESMLWFPPKTIIKESFSFPPCLFSCMHLVRLSASKNS